MAEKPRFINPWNAAIGAFIPNWLLRRTELTAGAKLTYARLAQYAGRRGVAFPKVETLAEEVAVEERSIRRYIGELEDLGLIYVERRQAQSMSSRYFFVDHPWMSEGVFIDSDDPALEEGAGPSGQKEQDPPDKKNRTLRTDLSALEEITGRESLEENHAPKEREAERSAPPKAPSPSARSPRQERSSDSGLGSDRDQLEEDGGSAPNRPQPKLDTKLPGEAKATRVPVHKAAEFVRDHMVAGTGAEAVEALHAQARARRERELDRLKKSDRAKQNLAGESPKPINYVRAVAVIEETWMDTMAKFHPDVPVAPWDAQRRGQAAKLAESYGSEAVDAVRYVVQHWKTVSEKMLGKPGDVPTIGFVLRFHDRIVPAARVLKKHSAVLEEYRAWVAAHPIDLPPTDLERRYAEAKLELEKIGVTA